MKGAKLALRSTKDEESGYLVLGLRFLTNFWIGYSELTLNYIHVNNALCFSIESKLFFFYQI